MTRLIHLNGPPGIGKSTLARRYADEHPGVLNCDIDVLRTMVGGWSDEFETTGALIRAAALAMIEAYLAGGHDVVLPQMVIDAAELSRFEVCARGAGADFVERILMADVDQAVERFNRRGVAEPSEAWHRHVQAIVAADGGRESLVRSHSALRRLIEARPDAQVIDSIDGSADATYQQLIFSLQ